MLDENHLPFIIQKVRNVSGFDFSDYAQKSLYRRFSRFLINYRLNTEDLLAKLSNEPGFVDTLIEEITVNTTELFRDVKIWQFLKYNVLPKLATRNKINIWSAGISSGQEVYSLMMLLSEAGLLDKSHIIATDVNNKMVVTAKKGIYKYRNNLDYIDNFDKVLKENPYNVAEKNNVDYGKYFNIDKANDKLVMHEFLRKKPVFLKHDLVNGGGISFTKFDLILCRNVLIYFNQELQNKVLNTFHSNMFKNSYLLLGIHESILGPVAQLYQKKGLIYINK